MQSDRPLLTIAIPTYNRAVYLRQSLEALLPQLGGHPEVELLISDNASPDSTLCVIQAFRERGLCLIHKRNEVNIGADANFLQCYELARGEYVWIVGDDDIIAAGAVAQILDTLETRKYDLVGLGSYGFSGDSAPPPRKLRGKFVEFANGTDYALRVYTGLAFITGNILRKERIESEPHAQFSDFIGTNLVHLSWTFTLLKKQPRCILLRDPLVAIRNENTGGYGTSQVFGKNFRDALGRLLGEDSAEGRALFNRNLQGFLPWAVVQDRSGKSIQNLPEDTGAVLRELYGSSPRFWIYLWPAIRLPLGLAKGWVFFIKIMGRVDRVLGHPLAR